MRLRVWVTARFTTPGGREEEACGKERPVYGDGKFRCPGHSGDAPRRREKKQVTPMIPEGFRYSLALVNEVSR